MSPRDFARRFHDETGVKPSRPMGRLRVEAAREKAEVRRDAIEGIAAAFGFGDSERVRRGFPRGFGQPQGALPMSAKPI